MKPFFLLLLAYLAVGCGQTDPPIHNFTDGQKVKVGSTCIGVVVDATDEIIRGPLTYPKVQWIDLNGVIQEDAVHYSLLTPIK